jgi:protein ImuA
MMPMASAARSAIPAPKRPFIGRLREQLRAAEAAQGLNDGARVLTLGIPAIDDALGGGLGVGALHEIAAACESAITSATGFALGLAAILSERTIVWIAEELSLAESGTAYGPGLDQAGIPPERLITVIAARGPEVLWAMEEALRCRAVGAVIGELRARTIDHVASRRLALAAAAGNTLGLILRPAPEDDASAAATRWIVGAASSLDGERSRVGPPRLAVRLARNRRGHLGAWIVEWDNVERRFVLAAHSEPMARAAADRPYQAAMA